MRSQIRHLYRTKLREEEEIILGTCFSRKIQGETTPLLKFEEGASGRERTRKMRVKGESGTTDRHSASNDNDTVQCCSKVLRSVVCVHCWVEVDQQAGCFSFVLRKKGKRKEDHVNYSPSSLSL